ncbi:hypothetical protein [Neisseria elongata]|uniref:hypothetical protein n=1 Tax=Neisseria elongata TaxID=495 RepID=UPI000D335963|nr:hypothetical protein [Neisseria elongata]
MKWLLFALLALNIAIFGGMTLPKIMEKQEAEMMAKRKEASARMTRDSADLPQPMVKPSDAGASETPASAVASASSGNWLTDNGGAADVYIEPTDTEEDTAKQIARLQDEKNRRQIQAKEEAMRRNKYAQGNNQGNFERQSVVTEAGQGNRCVTTANVSLPEDDYHRIKGLLNRWPHAASRTVERKEAVRSKTSYAVWTPIQIDAGSQMQALQSKGFNTVLMEGGISIGIRSDRAQAQALLNRLQGAGFTGQLREVNSGSSGGQSVAKMQITFMTVNDADIKAIQNIVGSYGRLSRNKCR